MFECTSNKYMSCTTKVTFTHSKQHCTVLQYNWKNLWRQGGGILPKNRKKLGLQIPHFRGDEGQKLKLWAPTSPPSEICSGLSENCNLPTPTLLTYDAAGISTVRWHRAILLTKHTVCVYCDKWQNYIFTISANVSFHHNALLQWMNQ